ncbi:Limulus clotting factor C [Orchesella cincta]|uniref:Limulus clotting factor C n=1 Tax=Orchesella cincta TaxID=48709 RepID=A0A1D2MIN9_ORCCI|nr:Limulus clotting factor C [Orchesella cincta]
MTVQIIILICGCSALYRNPTPDCGHPSVDLLGNSPVVVFGETATRESFPWHAAIFRSNGPGTQYQFYCGGSLITPSNKGFLVVTAAHCVTSSLRTHKVRPLDDFRVVLGSVSSNYKDNEKARGTQIFSVKAAKIHPSYDYNRVQNDIAIVKLNGTVKLSEYISPVCFPSREMANKQITGTGLISGFGLDETSKITKILNYARLPVTQNQICNYALGKELTSVEFCAGYSSGSSVCSGDSGGGLIFMDELTKRLYIQGIASNVDKRTLDEKKYCQNYNTFVRVSSFVDWVQDELDQFFSDVDDSADEQHLRQPGSGSRPTRPNANRPTGNRGEFLVTVYRDINDKSHYEEWRMSNCSAVPQNWNVGQFWVDVHGKCLQFFEGRVCSGRSLQLQPSPSSSVFKWNFPDFYISSVSLCQGGPPSSSGPSQGSQGGSGSSKPIGGPDNGNGQQGGFVPGSGSSNQGSNQESDYQVVGLRRHNAYRLRHGVPQVVLSEALNVKAKAYADKLINYNNLISSNEGGENLFQIRGSSESSAAIVKQAVDLWYDSMKDYNWERPTATSFSQLVWKSTREIGIGVARSRGRTVVVAKYSPPGNVFYGGADPYKYFRDNVYPPS